MHKRLIEPALQELDEQASVYIYDLVRQLENDPRLDDCANLVYLILRDAIPVLPTMLEPKIVIEDLFAFVGSQRAAIEHRIHSPRFIIDPSFVRPMVMLFVKTINDRCWERIEQGDVTTDGGDIWRMNWPYEEVEQNFPYMDDDEDDDEEEEGSAIAELEAFLQAIKAGGEKK